MSRPVPPEIRAIIEETTHRLKTVEGECHACKRTFTLAYLWPVHGCDYRICWDCKQQGNERLIQAIADAMADSTVEAE
jgi:hypothetical protein